MSRFYTTPSIGGFQLNKRDSAVEQLWAFSLPVAYFSNTTLVVSCFMPGGQDSQLSVRPSADT
jgi:hypothetical protein